MSPADAAQLQIERYRAMTGEQRLGIALGLHDFACDIAREGIRRQFPHATPDEVEQHLRRRIASHHQMRILNGEFLVDVLVGSTEPASTTC